jgi:hypothetical protein
MTAARRSLREKDELVNALHTELHAVTVSHRCAPACTHARTCCLFGPSPHRR